MKDNSGIYEIRNIINGKRYIGQSSHVKRRLSRHLQMLRNSEHFSKHLQNSWNKHGEENFSFRFLIVCSLESLTYFEQLFLDKLLPEYNKSPTAGSSRGVKLSIETRMKMSEKGKGRVVSDETKKKISKGNSGKIRSDEARRKLSERGKGKPLSVETRMKMSESRKGAKNPNYGKTISQETKDKISLSKIGCKGLSGESHPMYGKKHSQETRDKIGKSQKGKKRSPFSEETKRRMSESRKAYFNRIRNEKAP